MEIPNGDYLVISFGHPVSGVLVDEQAGEIRVPFANRPSVLLAAQSLTNKAEKRGLIITGKVVRDGG